MGNRDWDKSCKDWHDQTWMGSWQDGSWGMKWESTGAWKEAQNERSWWSWKDYADNESHKQIQEDESWGEWHSTGSISHSTHDRVNVAEDTDDESWGEWHSSGTRQDVSAKPDAIPQWGPKPPAGPPPSRIIEQYRQSLISVAATLEGHNQILVQTGCKRKLIDSGFQ